MAYRAWSHRKGKLTLSGWLASLTIAALKGSDHLDFIIDHRLFRPTSSKVIESLYERFATGQKPQFEFMTRAQIEQGDTEKEKVILPAGAHNEAAKVLQVPELSGEIERAVWQVEQEFRKQDEEQSRQASAVAQQQRIDEKREKQK